MSPKNDFTIGILSATSNMDATKRQSRVYHIWYIVNIEVINYQN
jgi:hypothetical protein